MKFLVISDTHGDIVEAKAVYQQHQDVTTIIHLGDYERDGWRLENDLCVPVVSVKGNLDGSHSNEDYKIHNTEFGKLFLTHGHMEAVKYDTNNLLYKASSLGCKAALFGHTHIPVYEDFGGMYLFNPGSLTLPRSGRRGSYGIIHTEPGQFSATILYWDKTGTVKEAETGVRSGFLRRMFNDSDGQ